jgi:hypothetical protein
VKGRRKPIRPSDRFEIFKRDNFSCGYCGRTPPSIILQVDHILAVSNGGGNDAANLITSCQECNLGKGDRELTRKLPSIQSVAEHEKEKFEQLSAYNDWLMEKAECEAKWFRVVSDKWIELEGEDPRKYVIAGKRAAAVRRFLKHLSLEEIIDALEVAVSRMGDKHPVTLFKYFCGVCWRKIERQE